MKDLLYSLKTQKKDLIRRLNETAFQLEHLDETDHDTLLQETLRFVESLMPTTKKYSATIKAVNNLWLHMACLSPERAAGIYQIVLAKIAATNWQDAKQTQESYQLLNAFYRKEFSFDGNAGVLQTARDNYAHEIFVLVDTLYTYLDKEIITEPLAGESATGSNLAEKLMQILYYHRPLLLSDPILAQAAENIPRLVKGDIAFGNNIVFSFFNYHNFPEPMIAELLDYYVRHLDVNQHAMFWSMMLEMLDNSSFLYAKLDSLRSHLQVYAQGWDQQQWEFFIQYSFFYAFKNSEDRQALLARSKPARAMAEWVLGLGHGEYAQHLAKDLQAADRREPFVMPVAGKEQFANLNLKLLVLEDLMYRRKLLQPKFDVIEFVRCYTQREIIIDEEGYDIIPEVLAYFSGLPIPENLLQTVEELGFDGANVIYSQIIPHWDGAGDEFDLVNIEDLELLPKLKRLDGMTLDFAERYQGILKARGIEVTEL